MKKTFFFFLSVLMMTRPAFGQNIKQPNVSGQFYTANPQQLSSQIDQFFAKANSTLEEHDALILISPHAGYLYSGGVAAYGYKALAQKTYQTVIVLSPSHYYGFDRISVWKEGGFVTPLGTLAVDQDLAAQLLSQGDKFLFAPQAFDQEHALEVQLPFVQKTFPGARIVPVIVGQITLDTAQALADSLDRVVGDRKDILIVVSSDMSHYHPDAAAKAMDRQTIQVIETLAAEEFFQKCQARELEMCGAHPVTAALLLARKRELTPRVLNYANSGDVTGDRAKVVGYTSILFYAAGQKGSQGPKVREEMSVVEGVAPLSWDQKRRLVELARETIETFVRTGNINREEETDPRLREPEGAFVTIHKHGQLRGCIGHIVAREPLFLTIRDMAVAAASQDPRFSPVKAEELQDLDVEVSVLSRPRVCTDVSEIIMGQHGVIVKRGMFNQGVFLPQVATETGWSREEFLSNLCAHKAGLPADCWKDSKTRIEIFTADVFSEKDFGQE